MLEEIRNVKVVLVEPLDSRNVGSVCRAAKSMGIRRLEIVGGRGLDLEEARVTAVHAADVLEAARYRSGLDEAVRGCVISAGVSRRRGRRRKYFALSPEELAERIAGIRAGDAALVFGNEESGLTDGELSLCNVAVKIPTSPLFPSLNLSHAVQIVCYQVYRHLGTAVAPRFTPIEREKLDRLVAIALKSLENLGFFKQVGPEDMGIFLRDILARAGLSGREARRLEVVFRKISGLAVGKGIGP